MKKVSIIVPVFNGEAYIESTLASITAQSYPELEIIVSDDAGSDGACALVRAMQERDGRIMIVGDGVNRGTLGARKLGVSASSGDFVMFVDQDDELEPDAVAQLVDFAEAHPADIYHFPARVLPENDAAREAAAGMQSFLAPPVQVLNGPEILTCQLKLEGGFDWHLHHKMFAGDLARKAYSCVPDVRLLQSDDFYLCFMMTALAQRYQALPSEPLYIYHLGRGDTFGEERTVESILGISANNAEAYRLIEAFSASPQAPCRDDWDARLSDAKCCLIDYPANEWKDALDQAGQIEALPQLLRDWPAEYIGAELWRFSRDSAYALWTAQNEAAREPSQKPATSKELRQLEEDACHYYAVALEVERMYGTKASTYPRYREMRQMALVHLRDTGLYRERAENRPAEWALSRAKRLARRFRNQT